LATFRTEDLGPPYPQLSEYTADPVNLKIVPNNIGHNYLVSVGLVLILRTHKWPSEQKKSQSCS